MTPEDWFDEMVRRGYLVFEIELAGETIELNAAGELAEAFND